MALEARLIQELATTAKTKRRWWVATNVAKVTSETARGGSRPGNQLAYVAPLGPIEDTDATYAGEYDAGKTCRPLGTPLTIISGPAGTSGRTLRAHILSGNEFPGCQIDRNRLRA